MVRRRALPQEHRPQFLSPVGRATPPQVKPPRHGYTAAVARLELRPKAARPDKRLLWCGNLTTRLGFYRPGESVSPYSRRA